MATYRIGIGSEFQLKDNAVGVGSTTTGLGNLIIDGTLKASILSTSGVTTFISYSGFSADEISGDVTLTGENLTTGDIVVGTGKTFTVSVGSTVDVGSVESVSIGTHFSPPTGGIEDRPECPVEGTVRFNRDLNTLEFYNGVEWRQFTVSGASGRAVIAGGISPGSVREPRMEVFNMNTSGNATRFGELQQNIGRFAIGRASSTTRGLFAGGQSPTSRDFIDMITIASEGNGIDFGDLNAAGRCYNGCSSSTRGLFGGTNGNDVVDKVEIATVGNAIDFGDWVYSGGNKNATFSSPTKSINNSGEAGGASRGAGSPFQNVTIESMMISSGGNSVVWGTLSRANRNKRGTSNGIRGLFVGGYVNVDPWPKTNHIDFITISSEGQSIEFGEVSNIMSEPNCTSSQTRSFICGGFGNPASLNNIEYVNIASTGNAIDFGDLAVVGGAGNALSDCHGGLGGY